MQSKNATKHRRKKAGECVDCGSDQTRGKIRCFECRKQQAAASEQRRKLRILRGVCTDCCFPTRDKTCQRCRNKKRDAVRLYRAKKAAAANVAR